MKRRRLIEDYLSMNLKKKYKIIFVESIFTTEQMIEQHIFQMKIKSVDYKDWDPEEAVKDYRKRIKLFEKNYDHMTIDNDGPSTCFIQIINQNRQILTRNLKGYLPSKLLSYLINLHTGERPIYFIKNGESEHEVKGIYGGDSVLSERGKLFSQRLLDYFKTEINYFESFNEKCIVYCSTLRRSIETAEKIQSLGKLTPIKFLDEQDFGLWDGLTDCACKEMFCKDYEERQYDMLRYRFPRGESYMDVIARIEPIIFELERHGGPIVLIGHHEVLKCLYGYFSNAPISDIPNLDIPSNTIIKFVPVPYGFSEERILIDIDGGYISKDTIKSKESLINLPTESFTNYIIEDKEQSKEDSGNI